MARKKEISGTSSSLYKGLSCELAEDRNGDKIVVNNDLQISFERTIRVPDNKQVSFLPPTLGCFPLKPISKYAKTLSMEVTAKGGLFLPMYRKYHS